MYNVCGAVKDAAENLSVGCIVGITKSLVLYMKITFCEKICVKL